MKRIYCNGIHALSSRIAMLIQENEYTEDDQILLTYGVEIWMEEIVKTGALLLGGRVSCGFLYQMLYVFK